MKKTELLKLCKMLEERCRNILSSLSALNIYNFYKLLNKFKRGKLQTEQDG